MLDLISTKKLIRCIQLNQGCREGGYTFVDFDKLISAIDSGELAPDQMYKPGDMICVRKGSLLLWFEREFVAMHKNQKWVWCLDDKEDHKALLWEQHKPIPKTITVELPVELVNEVKEFLKGPLGTNPVDKLLHLIID